MGRKMGSKEVEIKKRAAIEALKKAGLTWDALSSQLGIPLETCRTIWKRSLKHGKKIEKFISWVCST